MPESIEDIYQLKCGQPSDINEHLPVLKEYSSKVESIVELGVREMVSTWALLAGKPKRMLSVDIVYPKEFNVREVEGLCKKENIDFEFLEASSLEIEIPICDLLFIDTIHTYEQLSKELKRHDNKVNKFIILHDTTSCKEELEPAITEFIENGKWVIDKVYKNNNGITILKRI